MRLILLTKRTVLTKLLLLPFVCFLGCAALPDIKRMQISMEQMAYYAGVMAANMPYMAHSTDRIASTGERLDQKTQKILGQFDKSGARVESAFQNYSQAFLDNDRSVIKNLQGIRQELNEMKQSIGKGGDGLEQAKANAALQAKLKELDDRLKALTTRMEKTPNLPANSPVTR